MYCVFQCFQSSATLLQLNYYSKITFIENFSLFIEKLNGQNLYLNSDCIFDFDYVLGHCFFSLYLRELPLLYAMLRIKLIIY